MQKSGEGGQHSLHDFKEIIKQVRECKTAAQERELINKEKALIRERFLQGKEETRAKDVAKLLYIAMLGHNTDFGQMECLKLISSQNFGNKRVGYLGLCQLFHENSEVLMLGTNHIHLDLNHSNNYVVSLAIVALSEICTAEMCRELLPDLLKQFVQGQTFVKKKAALCCVKMAKLLPEATAEIVAGIDSLMEDKHHGVLLSTVTLMRSLLLENQENKTYFYKHITPLKKILKALISNMSAEFDVNGVNDPFLQILILDFFRMMAIGKQNVADEISGILGEVATNTNSDKNSGCAVLYECVKTVMEIGSTNSLKILCLNVLGKFLKSTEPNIKYASLFMIQKVLIYDIKTVQKYMSTILACLKEEDLSIKQLSLDLVYMVSSTNNVEAIVKELLNLMMDLEQMSFLPELILQTCAIVDKFAPNRRWHIDTVIKVLSLAGNYAKEDTINNLINLISVSPNLQQYTTSKLFHSLKAKKEQKGLAIAGLYCIGEFGQKLLSSDSKEDTPSQKDIFELIQEIFQQFPEDDDVKEYGMACLMKLAPKFSELEQSQFEQIFSSLSTSTSPEVQKRACEYLHIIQNQSKDQLGYVFQATPQYAKAASQFQGKPDDGFSSINKVNNLLEDVEDPTQNQSEQQQQNLLDDLIGAPSNSQGGNNNNSTSTPIARDLLSELMGDSEGQNSNSINPAVKSNLLTDLLSTDITNKIQIQPNSSTSGQGKNSNIIDLLGDDDEISSTPKQQQKSAAPGSEQHVFVPIEDNNIRVVFQCTKGADSQVEMNVQFGNKGSSFLTDLVFQVAVQKQNKLTMNPVSSTSIPPLSNSDTTQVLKVVNSMAGQKPLQLKVRLSYSVGGIPVSMDSIIQDFPKTW